MANGFGSLYIGTSGMQTSQNGLHVIGNNLTNVNTDGYVRQQVIYTDKEYNPTHQLQSIGKQQTGLGVSIGDVLHARDVFLDASYRTQNSRQTFYDACYDASYEVETFLQEMDGADFKAAIADLYEAFSEFAKDPADSANQNIVIQKSQLFIARSQALYNGLKEYQSTINTKISNDVDRINELGIKIMDLNKKIQRIEAADIETASTLRDARDMALDELSGLASITYNEQYNGVVTVKLEGQDFVTEARAHQIALKTDEATKFVTPYWPHLSEPDKDEYYEVFQLNRVSADFNNDRGEVKALLLARGDHFAKYSDITNVTDPYKYEIGIGNSVMLNSEAEIDLLIHNLVTAINDVICPNTTAGEALPAGTDYTQDITLPNGEVIHIDENTKILDADNCSVGSDNRIPPRELFTRTGAERYTEVTIQVPKSDGSGTEPKTIYLYNEEDQDDPSTMYTMSSIRVNSELVAQQSLLAHRTQTQKENAVDYSLGKKFEDIWTEQKYYLNASDETPCTFQEFYAKFVGDVATNANIFKATSESYKRTVDSVDSSRQQVFGVSSDEELTNMIKFQNAYNASSRYINTVNSMIDYLLSSL